MSKTTVRWDAFMGEVLPAGRGSGFLLRSPGSTHAAPVLGKEAAAAPLAGFLLTNGTDTAKNMPTRQLYSSLFAAPCRSSTHHIR
jgi:hypothetical protein